MARDLSLILLNAQSQGNQKHVANRLHYALVLLELNARNAAEHQLSQWESQSLVSLVLFHTHPIITSTIATIHGRTCG